MAQVMLHLERDEKEGMHQASLNLQQVGGRSMCRRAFQPTAVFCKALL